MRELGTKQQQLEEIKTQLAPWYAEPDCEDCFGTGEMGWLESEQRYRICYCVLRNIGREREELVN